MPLCRLISIVVIALVGFSHQEEICEKIRTRTPDVFGKCSNLPITELTAVKAEYKVLTYMVSATSANSPNGGILKFDVEICKQHKNCSNPLSWLNSFETETSDHTSSDSPICRLTTDYSERDPSARQLFCCCKRTNSAECNHTVNLRSICRQYSVQLEYKELLHYSKPNQTTTEGNPASLCVGWHDGRDVGAYQHRVAWSGRFDGRPSEMFANVAPAHAHHCGSVQKGKPICRLRITENATDVVFVSGCGPLQNRSVATFELGRFLCQYLREPTFKRRTTDCHCYGSLCNNLTNHEAYLLHHEAAHTVLARNPESGGWVQLVLFIFGTLLWTVILVVLFGLIYVIDICTRAPGETRKGMDIVAFVKRHK